MNKTDEFLNNSSNMEKESNFEISPAVKPKLNLLRYARQGVRILMFYIIIFVVFIFIIKSLTDDLTLINYSGLNFFNLCNFPYL